MTSEYYELDPKLKTFYEELGKHRAQLGPLLTTALSAEYRDKVLKEGMDPHYAAAEAKRVGDFRNQQASRRPMYPNAQEAAARGWTQSPGVAPRFTDWNPPPPKPALCYTMPKIRVSEADLEREKENQAKAKAVLADVYSQPPVTSDMFGHYLLVDKADRIALAVADAIDDRTWFNDDLTESESADLLRYTAEIVRQGFGLPTRSDTYKAQAGEVPTMANYEQAATPKAPPPPPPQQPKVEEDNDPGHDGPILTDVQESESNTFWSFVDTLRDELDVYSKLFHAHASYLNNQVIKGTKSPFDAFIEFRDWAREKQGKRRYTEQTEYLNVAATWASKSGLTTTEACAGVARDLYLQKHEVKGAPEVIRREFNEAYDYTFAEDVKARHIRAAYELFGST